MSSKYFKIDAKLEKGAGVTPFYGTVTYLPTPFLKNFLLSNYPCSKGYLGTLVSFLNLSFV